MDVSRMLSMVAMMRNLVEYTARGYVSNLQRSQHTIIFIMRLAG
jgi:hypothetical protein